MAKQRIFDLTQTKGEFVLRGIVSGTKKDSFYSEKKTKTDKLFRKVNFGIEYEKGHTVYVTLQGMESDNVWFSKVEKVEDENNKMVTQNKIVTEKVPWADRFSFNKEGYGLIGVNCGLTKMTNESGKIVNDKKTLTEFDACSYIFDNLNDGDSVFVKGLLDISSFIDDKGNKKTSLKLKPNQISLCSLPIDFDDEKFVPVNEFKTSVVFKSIDKEVNDNGEKTNRFVLSTKIINYATIEDYNFIIGEEQEKFARMLNKKFKPYNSFEVFGRIVSTIITEVVEEDDEWGEPDPFKKPNSGAKTEMIITGANKETWDTESYSEESVNAALMAIAKENKAKNNYGKDADEDTSTDDDWGSVDSFDEDDDVNW